MAVDDLNSLINIASLYGVYYIFNNVLLFPN